MRRVGALASGTGSILESILDAEIAVDLVVTDRRCAALELAEARGVPVELVERTDFTKSFDRDAYSDDVVAVLQKYEIDVVLMAGFGTVRAPNIKYAADSGSLSFDVIASPRSTEPTSDMVVS